MTSAELADCIETLIRRVSERVEGTGDEQYSLGNTQKFETLNILQLIEWTLEEVEDSIAYAAMQHIRMVRLREAVEAAIRTIGSTSYSEHKRVQEAIAGLKADQTAAVGLGWPTAATRD